MIQTEKGDSNIIVSDNNNMEIRTIDECLAVYKTQVKLTLFLYLLKYFKGYRKNRS